MSFNDPVSDLLTRIRNAQQARHRYTEIYFSKFSLSICEALKVQGFVGDIEVVKDNKRIRVYLKYNKERKPVIQGLKRISRPGVRRYVGYDSIPYVFRGMGISLLSTSKGVMTGDEARRDKVGGEVLCYVW